MNDPQSSGLMLFVAAFSGVSFSLIGISYRTGQAKGLIPRQVALVLCAFGAVFFAAKTSTSGWSAAPLIVIVLGLLSGITQYMTLHLMGEALKRGPLSPLWCAVSLSFLPVVIYAGITFGEALTFIQYAGIVAAMGCVFLAAFEGPNSATPAAGHVRPGGHATYAAILVAILLLNSVPSAAIKYMGMRPLGDATVMASYGPFFSFLLYVALGGCILADLCATRRLRAPARWMLPIGAMGAAGSIGGLLSWGYCASMPAAMLFTISCVMSIFTAALVSVFAFGEKATRAWYGMLACGVASVVLLNVKLTL
jgi:drug/metabolite transporter (DMT)-like permease